MLTKRTLLYSAQHYSEKLAEYAAYTIDIATPVGVFRQKVNKRDDITVVDEGNGRFRVYMSYIPLIGPVTIMPTTFSMRQDLFAQVTITDSVTIDIKRNNLINYPLIGWNILLVVIACVNVFNIEPPLLLLLLPLTPLPFLLQQINKKRFKNLLIHFMNTTAA